MLGDNIILLNGFYLNGHSLAFYSQTQKFIRSTNLRNIVKLFETGLLDNAIQESSLVY